MVDTAYKVDAVVGGRVAPPMRTVPRPPIRDLTRDLVKGALVVIMVVNHAMTIFSPAGPEESA